MAKKCLYKPFYNVLCFSAVLSWDEYIPKVKNILYSLPIFFIYLIMIL
jgi:hypothetical protein